MPRAQGWIGVGLAVAGAVLLVVGSFRQAARATTDPPPGAPGLEDRCREGDDLDVRLAVTHARLLDKHEIAMALIRGTIGLPEAADRFRPLVAAQPHALDKLRPGHPSATETELLYRHILKFVRGVLALQPDLDRGVLARLEAELAATFPGDSNARPGTAIDSRVPARGAQTE